MNCLQKIITFPYFRCFDFYEESGYMRFRLRPLANRTAVGLIRGECRHGARMRRDHRQSWLRCQTFKRGYVATLNVKITLNEKKNFTLRVNN